MPADFGRTPARTATTQAALGRALLDLTRDRTRGGRRIVTVSPDVSSSLTWPAGSTKSASGLPAIGSTGSPTIPRPSCTGARSPTGQHLELGIAETNLVGLLGELGATWTRWGEPLLPIGVMYDPFVERALEPWSFGIYAGGQSILSVPRPASASPPKAAPTSRSPPRRSASSSPGA